MKFLAAFLTLLFLLTACSKRQDSCEMAPPPPPKLLSINLTDVNGMSETISHPERIKQYEEVDFLKCQNYKKVMRIYARDQSGCMSAKVTTYHPNGQPKQYLEVVNGRAYGQFKEWFDNGQLKVEATVISGEPDVTESAEKTWLFTGISLAYNNCGQKIAEISYSNGVLNGVSTYYHPSGNVWKIIPYSQGMMEGTAQIFRDNGELLQSTEYVQGEPNGLAIRYWTCSQIASEECFNCGKLLSGKYYDTDGTLITEVQNGNGKRTLFGKNTVAEIIEIKNGVPEGRVEMYNQKGECVSTHMVKNALKHGEEQIYYPGTPLKIKLSVNWYEGKIRGLVKTWYPNGQIESQKEMSDNQRNGLLTSWYLDGSLMLMEEYEKDRLVKGEYFRKGDKTPISEVSQGEGTASLFDPEGHFIRKVPYHLGKPSF